MNDGSRGPCCAEVAFILLVSALLEALVVGVWPPFGP